MTMKSLPVIDEVEEQVATALQGSLSENDRSALRAAVRVAFEFGAYLARGDLGAPVDLGPIRSEVRSRLEQFLSNFGAGCDIAKALSEGVSIAADDYVNNTTVSALESFERTEEIAGLFGEKRREPPMEGWPVYSGVSELGAEYARHLEILGNSQLELEVRLHALLDLMRLQLVFLANTAF
jgi:hypothetical protein